jgi:serine/threonine-protein kinase HipA
MPTSAQPAPNSVFVWVWLPGKTEPVVAGRIDASAGDYVFAYGRSYLERSDAISLYRPELPLHAGAIRPIRGLRVAGCLRDGSPDAWGRRVVLARRFGHVDDTVDPGQLDELTYMIESGSDRIGALDFQRSATDYVPRDETAALGALVDAAVLIEQGKELPPALGEALVRGTSIGGARPKVTLRADDASTREAADATGLGKHLIAKLSSSTDYTPVVKAEAVGMILARHCGIDVATVKVTQVMAKDVLLVDRFDRTDVPGERRLMVSALTILGLDELGARYAGYPDIADAIRRQFKDPTRNLRELYSRLVFNVCIGNTDDHLRNHAAFWDGHQLDLTPAYDLYPNPRTGQVANQALDLTRVPGDRASQLRLCLMTAENFLIDTSEAQAIIDAHIETITSVWDDAADEARLTRAERSQLWGWEILNPYIHYDQA